jgi:hypothetical protein
MSAGIFFTARSIEIGAYDLNEANDTISNVCRRFNCRDFEISWD